jgi:hypothetical protein
MAFFLDDPCCGKTLIPRNLRQRPSPADSLLRLRKNKDSVGDVADLLGLSVSAAIVPPLGYQGDARFTSVAQMFVEVASRMERSSPLSPDGITEQAGGYVRLPSANAVRSCERVS